MSLARRDTLRLLGSALLVSSVQRSSAQVAAPAAAASSPPSAPSAAGVAPPLSVLALGRLGYGWRPGDAQRWAALPGASDAEKLSSLLEVQLRPEAIADPVCEAKLAGLDTLNKPLEQLWKQHWVEVPEGDKKYEEIYRPTNEVRIASVVRKIYSERGLLERMTEFWHDHFNVDPGRDDRAAPLFADYDHQLRQNALGNFRDLLVGVARHPVMLYYLDNASSNRSGPNENYARELFELHTLGAENYRGVGRQRDVPGFAQGQPIGYVDDDVYEATRAFTGWRVNDNVNDDDWQPGVGKNGTFLVYTPWHDRFQKTVLGRYLPPDQAPLQDGLDVLETLARHPGTARFLSRKLVRRFVSDTPPQRLVDAVSQVWLERRDAPDQMAHVLRAIVRSPEFAASWGQKHKRPLETFVSSQRLLESELRIGPDLVWHTDWMGQMPHGWTPPNGYPDLGSAWRSSTRLLRAWQYLMGLAHSWDERWKTQTVQTTGGRTRPSEIADFWLERLLGYRPESVRRTLIQVLAEGADPDAEIENREALEWRTRNAVAFTLMSPEFLTR